MTDLSGRDIGGYRLLSLLGSGGMGDVYRARDLTLGRDVAIKVLPAAFGRDEDRLNRFAREARLLASLNHPHVAAIYGTADKGNIHALVLELVEGVSLSERITLGLSVKEALRIADQIAEGLDAAHEKGIVHRDLKPDNIKITPDGAVKILDFGIAKMTTDTDAHSATVTSQTAAGAAIGTAAFMSPEQARGRTVDKRTDIWAFGCVLYEMLSGKRAFPGDTASHTIVAVLEQDPDWSALPRTLPTSVLRLLKRCLEKDPRQRLRDIGDARADLQDAASDRALPQPAAVSVKSSLLPWALAAVLGGVAALLLWNARTPAAVGPAAPTLARMIRLTNTPEREFGPAISPDGKWVAYYSDLRGKTDVWVKYLDSGATLNLTSTLDLNLPVRTNIGGLSISPDGRNLAFFGSTDTTQPVYDTWVIPAPLGGLPRKLLQNMQGARWSPDGTRLACILPGSILGDALIVADADGSNTRTLVSASGGRHIHWPVWAADGRSIYFIYTFQPWNTEQSEIYRVSGDGGPVEPVARSIRRAVYPVPLPGGDLLFAANPDSVDLRLWWQSSRGGPPRALTTGIGEYSEPQLSADGQKLVSTVVEPRQSLVMLSATETQPPHPLTDGYSGDLDPSADPTSDRIVFSSTRSGYRNLWTAREDGTEVRPFTSGTSNDDRPAFSPDGRQIAFVSDRGGQWGIWVMSASGGAARLLTHTVVLDPLTWSRDGSQVIYSTPGTDRSTELRAVSVADGKTRVFPTPAAAFAPSCSPTADAVAYLQPSMETTAGSAVPISKVVLRFVDAAGRPLFGNLPEQRLTNALVAYSPDGRRVAVIPVPANAPSSILIFEPEGRTPLRKVTEFPPTVRPRGLTWTRDGSHIIVGRQESLSDLVLYELGR